MDIDQLIAIDTHTDLEVSCRNPFDSYGEKYDRAADKSFRSSRRPTLQETIDHYREKKSLCTSPISGPTCRAGARNISRPSSFSTPAARLLGLQPLSAA